MKNLSHKWLQSRALFPKIRVLFCNFQKRAEETYHPLPHLVTLASKLCGQVGVLGQNLKMEKPKFPNLLILEHLKSHFI